MQLASWKQDQPTTLEIELDSADNLQCVRWLSWKDNDKTTWSVSDICLGGSLAPKLLAFTLPASMPVREVDEANPFELVGSFMKLIGVLGEKVMKATR
jgi:hypothetical protein